MDNFLPLMSLRIIVFSSNSHTNGIRLNNDLRLASCVLFSSSKSRKQSSLFKGIEKSSNNLDSMHLTDNRQGHSDNILPAAVLNFSLAYALFLKRASLNGHANR